MDRRTFLKSGVVAATGAGAASTAMAAPMQKTSSVAVLETVLSQRFAQGYLRDRADRFALRIKELTEGRIILNFKAASPANTSFECVCNSSATAYFGTEAEHLSEHRGLAYFSALPKEFSLTPEYFTAWLAGGGGQSHWDAIASDFGVKSFAVGHSGRRAGVWADRDLENLSSLVGLQGDVTGMAAEIVKRLGVKISAANSDEAALVAPLMGPTAWLADDGARRRFWFRDGIYQDGVVLSFGLSQQVWQRFSAADQAVIATCANEAYHQSLAEHAAHEQAVAPHLFAAYAIQKRTLPDDILKAMQHMAMQLLSEWRSADAATARIHDSYMQFRNTMTGSIDPFVSKVS